jgi:phosphoribosylaminoimidazole carboxylase (NCAIR synthetase)
MRIDWRVPAALALLAACQPEEARNIQAEAEDNMRKLENRAEALTVEAENVTDEAVRTVDNQAVIFANQADALLGGAGNQAEAENKQ